MAHLGVFVIGQYSVVNTRRKKPFNPILGETYEFLTDEWRWCSEQVSHHPPICAFHCEGDYFDTYGNTDIRNYFWGGSLELKILGLQHFTFKDT